jgi:hypothetical protein
LVPFHASADSAHRQLPRTCNSKATTRTQTQRRDVTRHPTASGRKDGRLNGTARTHRRHGTNAHIDDMVQTQGRRVSVHSARDASHGSRRCS